jgi:diguanylate cyclase (GGDEF)-like protein/PAS domain S-box-containing protein
VRQSVSVIASSGHILSDSVGWWLLLLVLTGVLAMGWRFYRRHEDAARRRAMLRFHAARADIGQALLVCQDEPAVLRQICAEAVRNGHCSLARFSQSDPHGETVVLAEASAIGAIPACAASALTDSCLAPDEGPLVFFSDLKHLRKPLPWQASVLKLGIRACAALPILKEGRPWAVLSLYFGEPAQPAATLRAGFEQLAFDISSGLDRLDAQRVQAALLDNARAGIVLTKSRTIQRSNAMCARMLGYAPGELLGQSSRCLYQDAAEYQRVGEAYAQMLASGKARLESVRYVCRDGSILSCDVTGVMLTGLPDQWVVWTLEDITQRDLQSQRLERLARFNAFLAETHRVRGTVDDKLSLFGEVCRAAVGCAGVLLAWIGEPETDSGVFRVLTASGAVSGLDPTAVSVRLGTAGCEAPTAVAWREDRPVFLRHARADAALGDVSEDVPRMAVFAALPVHDQGRVCAVLTVCCRQGDLVDDDTQPLLEALAYSIDNGLQDIRQRSRITRLQHLYRALIGESDVVLQARSAHEMLSRTCEKLVQGTPFHASWVARPDAERGIEMLACAGEGARQLASIDLADVDGKHVPLVTRCWRERRTVYNNDHLNDPLLSPWRDFLRAHHWRSVLAAPVLRDGRVWAVLVFVSPQSGVFDAQTIELCEFVCALLGHGLDEMDLKQRLGQLQQEEAYRARHDALTGLPNRYAMEQHLARVIAQSARTDAVVAVGMIDLDDFKPVNDTWGHEAGDRLLQALAQRMQASLRATDLLARLGGDEFLLVVEGVDATCVGEQLQQVFARLHQAVETPFELAPGEEVEVGMSMGVALFPQDGVEPDMLVRLADAAMYQIKTRKDVRSQWWCVGAAGAEASRPEPEFDPYGEAAAVLLTRTSVPLGRVCEAFSEVFDREVSAESAGGGILAGLDADGLARIRRLKTAHLHFLLAPETRREAVLSRGAELGRLHALVGVPGSLLTLLRAKFRALLADQLNHVLLSSRDRYRILLVVDGRLQDDLQAELDASQAVSDTCQAFLARPLPLEHLSRVDASRAEMNALATLPGVLACALMRPNAQGVFQIEASSGTAADVVSEILAEPGLQPVFDTREQAGQGIIPLAWRSGMPEHSRMFFHDARTRAWHHLGDRIPVRSMVAVPIKEGGGIVTHVLAVYGVYPNQFESKAMRQFASSLQQRLTIIWQRFNTVQHGQAIEERTARLYREQLFAGGLEMFMQPIVDINSGALVKVEALARLRMPDGQTISPGMFLPLLGHAEFDRLFRLSLDQALIWARNWEADGLHVGVSVNLPPCTLQDPSCPLWVDEALKRHQVDPGRLYLELLEHQGDDFAAQNRAMRRLNRLGVHLAMDDLGSGYSSLQRLSALLFSAIKSDQALLARAHANPVQTLSLLSAIIQMGRDFECDVVIEGLEDPGMVEAAVILGARLGQGYALGRPMPARQLPAWLRTFRLPTDPDGFHTPLGALAFLWQAMHADGCVLSNSVGDCPLARYLCECGEESNGLASRLHAQIHAGIDRQQSAHQLMDLLCGHVRRARRSTPAVADAR